MKKMKFLTVMAIFFVGVIFLNASESACAAPSTKKVYDEAVMTVNNKYYYNFQDGWNYARSISLDETPVVTLYHDWEADDDGKFGEGKGFEDDGICISEGRSIILNLNGHTIDRHLDDWEYSGYVIHVRKNATLTINGGIGPDDERIGTITGGYSCDSAGGIHVSTDADLTLNYVSVSGNKTEDDDGTAIALYKGTTLNMKGGEITNNTCSLSTEAAFMRLEIYGGGIYMRRASGVSVDGVLFEGNTMYQIPNLDTLYNKGSVICIEETGNVKFSNCTFRNNEQKKDGHSIIAMTEGSVNELTLENCYFNESNAYFLFYNYGGTFTMKNSKVESSCKNMSRFSGEKVLIEDCEIINTGKNLMHVDNDGVTFKNCTVTESLVGEGEDFFNNSDGQYKVIVENTTVNGKLYGEDNVIASIFGEGSSLAVVVLGVIAAAALGIAVSVVRKKKKEE